MTSQFWLMYSNVISRNDDFKFSRLQTPNTRRGSQISLTCSTNEWKNERKTWEIALNSSKSKLIIAGSTFLI